MVDSNTLVLLHFDEDYSDMFSDDWLTYGTGISIDNSDSKFGDGSLRISNNSYLASTQNERFNFLSNDFTIDLWFKLDNSSSGNQTIFASNSDFKVGVFCGSDAHLNWFLSSNGSSWNLIVGDVGSKNGHGNITVTSGWHHLAYVRSGTTVYGFLDGQIDIQVNGITDPVVNRLEPMRLGYWGANTYSMVGNIDEFRVSDIARWTSDFTPPIYPYGTNFAFLVNNNLYTGASLTNLTNNWSGLTNVEKEALVPSFSSEIPSIQDLSSISPFRVLTDDTSSSNVKVTGQPKPQTIEPTSLINTGAVSTVQSINITNTITDATVKFAITTDLTTYKVYDAVQGAWVTSTDVEQDGMSIAQINALTPQILALLDVSNGIAFKQCFIATSENALAEVSEISAVVDIDGSWSQSVHGTDYNVSYPNKTTMSVTLLTNGDYIINYPISSNS